MDKKSKREMISQYSNSLRKHGNSIKSLFYKSAKHQNIRFKLMVDVEPMASSSSVLDVGCGLGHFCEFLRKAGWQGIYTGIDINPDMISAAKKRLPYENFVCTDILDKKFSKMHDYVFCGATIQHRPAYQDPVKYFEQMIERMFSLAKSALIFDIFSNRVDYMDDDKLYIDPVYLLNFCYMLTRRLVIRNDYRPYEIMVYLYKKAKKDKHNIYSDWKDFAPRIV